MLSIPAEEYAQKSSVFENSLCEDYKKQNGIFYTDVKLAQSIVEQLDIKNDAIVLDPCCGTGNFLFAAISDGCTKVYGADLDGKAVSLCRKLTGLKSVKKMDTLGKKGEFVLKSLGIMDKADFVIGNPPYRPMEKNNVIDTDDYDFFRAVKDAGNNLFIAAIYRSFELAKKDGYICYIVPKNFLHIRSYSILRREIINTKRIVSIIDIGKYFSDVRGEQVILTIQNSFRDDNIVKLKRLVDDRFVDCCDLEQNFYRDVLLLFRSVEEYSIYCKMQKPYKRFSDICTGYVGRGRSTGPDAVSGKDIRKFGFKNMAVPEKGNKVFIQNIYSAEAGIIACFAGDLEARETVTVFTDGDEKMCRYILGILHSRLCNFYLLKFCYNSSSLTMHTDKKYLYELPLVKDDRRFKQMISLVKIIEKVAYMTPEWFNLLEDLNRLVYKIYAIDEDEAKYIDEEMASIQSKRWSNDK